MRRLQVCQAVVVAALWAPLAAGNTVTFIGPSGILSAGDAFTVENGFAYGAATDVVYRDGATGNPAPGIIGNPSANSTYVLTLVRDGGNPLFTFDSLDVYQQNLPGSPIVVIGKLNNVVVASDSFTPSTTNLVTTNYNSLNLAGQTIDRLEIALSAQLDVMSRFEGVDNVVLTAVPEPASAALLAIGGVGGLVALRRRRR